MEINLNENTEPEVRLGYRFELLYLIFTQMFWISAEGETLEQSEILSRLESHRFFLCHCYQKTWYLMGLKKSLMGTSF